MKRSNKEEFIKKANKVHNNKYDYSKVEYVNSQTKVCIICPKHGEFWQKPNTHLNGHGCPKCCKNGVKYTTKDFIEKSTKLYGNKYDYSKVEYKNRDTKVCIICPEHGEFWQSPHEHMHGYQCPKCGNKNLTLEEFIAKARKIHGDKYDYSKVNLVKMHQKVCIICPEHGEFWQPPTSHLVGQGCPFCKESHLEKSCRILFTDYNIKFIQQAGRDIFPWIGLQSFDFYLPDYNVVIECQGKQHFMPNCNFGSKKITNALDVIQARDNKKRELCKEHNIKILYFSTLKIKYPYDVITKKENLIKAILNSVP